MKVHFEKKACLVEHSRQVIDVTPAKLNELRTSVVKAEKEIGQIRMMASNLQNMRDSIY